MSSPREVKNTLSYVLMNAQHHGIHVGGGIDPFSSACWFGGWKRKSPTFELVMRYCPLPRARTWLLTLGWALRGELELV